MLTARTTVDGIFSDLGLTAESLDQLKVGLCVGGGEVQAGWQQGQVLGGGGYTNNNSNAPELEGSCQVICSNLLAGPAKGGWRLASGGRRGGGGAGRRGVDISESV